MKPEGRALDIAVVGLGQAGGNIAAEFFRRGYRALALNTAHTDLAALDPGGVYPTLPGERRVYIGLDGYDGAGADPAYGRDCIQENAERIRTTILKHAGDSDAVILAAGLGGGTGSAIGELVRTLSSDELPLVCLLTLPTNTESGLAKVNAVRAVNEVVDADLFGWIFVDNNRIAALHPKIPIVDYYAQVNAQLVDPIDDLNRLNERDDVAVIRAFDGEDFRKLFLSGGVLNYATVELPSLDTDVVLDAVRTAVESSDLMPGGFELARLSFLGVIIEAPARALTGAPYSVFENIEGQLKAETKGAAIFPGIYRTADKSPVVLRMIAVTQSLPERVRQVLVEAKREGSALGQKIKEEIPSLELGEIENVELFRTNTRPSERPRRARSSERPSEAPPPRARPVPTPAAVAPAPRAESEPEPTGARDPRARRSRGRVPPARRAPAPSSIQSRPTPRPADPRRGPAIADLNTEALDIDLTLDGDGLDPDTRGGGSVQVSPRMDSEIDTGDLPSPDVYDALVATYLSAETPSARQDVVDRLEADSASDNSIVRYYAVEAMAKLGAEIFGPALEEAAQDSNDEVRSIAFAALKRSGA